MYKKNNNEEIMKKELLAGSTQWLPIHSTLIDRWFWSDQFMIQAFNTSDTMCSMYKIREKVI